MNLTYKLIENGYEIYLNGQKWIGQGGKYSAYIPYQVNNEDGTINLEESAKAHIQEILDGQTQQEEQQSQLDIIEANTTYLVMMTE